jgi:hypothetical protein
MRTNVHESREKKSLATPGGQAPKALTQRGT